jgi:hypothetical protein
MAQMNGTNGQRRPNPAHNLPMAVASPRIAAVSSRPDAAFLAQILANRAMPSARANSDATGAYRLTNTIDVKRMPAGYRRTVNA